MAKKPLEIDMCAGSQLRDTQGEMLSVEGADIDDLLSGKGRINDNHGKGFFNSIGRVLTAKKILSEKDCEDDRHKYYWEKVKAPYIYVKAALYDDEDHPNAKAAAAILRNIHKSDVPLKLKASVEGGVISRGISDSSLLSKTKIHSIALTFTPANNATLVEPISLDKASDEEADIALIKSVVHLAQTNIPSFRHITRDASASKVHQNIEKIFELMKNEDKIDVPSKEDILEYALTSKIENNIQEINKGFKEIAAAGLISASALSPSVSPKSNLYHSPKDVTASISRDKLQKMHVSRFIQDAQKDPLLHAIGAMESTGGKFFDKHRTINSPKNDNHGMTAGGAYGVMPLTAQDVFRQSKKISQKYPEFSKLVRDAKNNHKEITNALNNDPSLGTDITKTNINLNSHIFQKNGIKPSEEALLYAHNHGINKALRVLKNDPDSIHGDEYVNKAKAARGITRVPTSTFKKALTAGYGGATSPTSRFGGSVLQTESLNDGKKGLKYVTCDHCGKEQVYSKFQTKCRECSKSWSLEKLHKIMSELKGTI